LFNFVTIFLISYYIGLIQDDISLYFQLIQRHLEAGAIKATAPRVREMVALAKLVLVF
jgi:hypothetical protein